MRSVDGTHTKPRVCQSFADRHAFLGVFDKQFRDPVLGVVGDWPPGGVRQIGARCLRNVEIGLVCCTTSEWRYTGESTNISTKHSIIETNIS